MVLSTEWSQVEVIDLVNDGSGLGFGIVGGRSTGVVVKSILPGGIADRDGRLQSGDHILQIGDVQTRGLASEHVATILRQCSLQVRIVVARPVEPTTCGALGSDAPIVPTKTLTDPDELETLLMQQNGYPQDGTPSSASVSLEYEQQSKILDTLTTYPIITNVGEGGGSHEHNEAVDQFNEHSHSLIESPESETIQVHLEKNSYGLGITVAGYVWEREELSGIFVKGISEGSAAHLSGQIHLNDRIVEVDRQSLRGVTNHEAVEMLRRTGNNVDLVLERYLRGPRYEHLLNALQADHPAQSITNNNNNRHISPSSPSITTLSWFPVHTADNTDTFIEPEPESHTTIDSLTVFEPPDPDTIEVFVDPHFESGSITPDLDLIVKKRWNSLIGDDTEIVVAQLRKLRGLGISLEGTVDVEDGVELRPRHFIRSILPEGPVGRNGKLNTGDELLEVNGQKLLGRNHVDVVKILKELPETVRIVCARNNYNDQSQSRVINTAQDREGFAARNLLSGSLRTLLNVNEDQQVASVQVPDEQLDMSLNNTNTSSTATLADVDLINAAISTEDDLVLIHENGYNSTPEDENNIESFLKNETDEYDSRNHKNVDCDEFENDEEEGAYRDDFKNHQNDDHDGFQNHHENDLKNEDFKNIHNGGHDDDDDKKHEDCTNNVLKNNQENGPDAAIKNYQAGDIYDQLNTKNGDDNQLKNLLKIKNDEFEKEIAEEKIFNKELENKKCEGEQMESSDCSPPKLTKHHHHNQNSKSSSASRAVMECVTYLAIWKQEIELIELYKGNKGLGFSILDYQDPLDPNGTVIVVRSLVHGGCAELDGRLRPGDRIMCVNNISLKNVTLEYAVKALKGTALGPVRIGFSKPMPLTKQHTNTIASASEHRPHDDDDDDQTQHTPLSIQDNYFIW